MARRNLFLLVLAFAFALPTFSQSPLHLPFLFSLKQINGQLLIDINFEAQLYLINDFGEIEYQEMHNLISDNYGNVNLIVGNGYNVEGNLSQVPFSTSKITIEIQPLIPGVITQPIYQVIGAVPFSFYTLRSLYEAGEGINISNSEISLKQDLLISPLSSRRGSSITLVVIGGENEIFSLDSSSCDVLLSNIKLELVNSTQGSSTQGSSTQGSSTQGSSTQGSSTQGSSTQGSSTQGSSTQNPTNPPSTNTTLWPAGIYFINPKRWEATFVIASTTETGEYNIIIDPNGDCPLIIPSAFRIY